MCCKITVFCALKMRKNKVNDSPPQDLHGPNPATCETGIPFTMKRARGRPPKKKGPKYHLGKASALRGELWPKWLQHVLKEGPTWLYVCLLLTHCLCCRVSEVLRLQRKEFNFRNNFCEIKPLKGGRAMRKHILSTVMPKLKQLRDRGISKRRSRKQGARGTIIYQDRWAWPSEENDYLFPSERSDSKEVHRCKDTVCKAIGRLRKTFQPPKNHYVHTHAIRSHSGRHRMVNDLRGAGVPDNIAMSFARICDKRTFAGYGQLTDEQTGISLEKNVSFKRTISETYKLDKSLKKNK